MKNQYVKKKYVLKKSDAIKVADPIAEFHRKDDEKMHTKILKELLKESSTKAIKR
jgi:hypothetical protein